MQTDLAPLPTANLFSEMLEMSQKSKKTNTKLYLNIRKLTKSVFSSMRTKRQLLYTDSSLQ